MKLKSVETSDRFSCLATTNNQRWTFFFRFMDEPKTFYFYLIFYFSRNGNMLQPSESLSQHPRCSVMTAMDVKSSTIITQSGLKISITGTNNVMGNNLVTAGTSRQRVGSLNHETVYSLCWTAPRAEGDVQAVKEWREGENARTSKERFSVQTGTQRVSNMCSRDQCLNNKYEAQRARCRLTRTRAPRFRMSVIAERHPRPPMHHTPHW